MFGKRDGLTFEDEDIEAKEEIVDTPAEDEVAAEPADTDEVVADDAGDDAEDEVIEDDTDAVDVDDDAEATDEDDCCGDELETTMNPAADEVEVSEDGYAGDTATEDDELLDAEPTVTAPTSFNPNEVPESNIQA
ncbi:MAG: hypothetical protein J5614_04205 [Paludibacteraceae bacterium]|nr:hypothetical protein [Paludibacteraceae bacterium]